MTLLSRTSALRLLPISAALLAFVTASASAQSSSAAASTQKDPDRSAAYYHYGLAQMYEQQAVTAGRPDYATQAIEEYKLALNADPTSKFLQDGLADLYFKIGRIREAVTTAQLQVKQNPNDIEAHELLGKVYLRSLGDSSNPQTGDMLQAAIGEYEVLARLQPQKIETHLLLGQLYGYNHDSAKAEEQFKLAQQIDGGSEEVVLNMARLFSEEGDNKRAVDAVLAVPQDDRTAREELALGAGYDSLHKPKEAAAAYRRSLAIEADNLDAERGLANALMLDGQNDEALKIYTQVVTAEPGDAQSYIRIAELQRRGGHYDAALATLNKAKTLVSTDNLELDYNEALTYDSLGKYDQAVAVLTRLVADSTHDDGKYTDGEKSNRTAFLDRLAIIYREQEKTTEAVAAYKQIVSLGGEYADRGYQGEVDSYRDAHQWKEATAAAADAARAQPKDRGIQLMYAGQLADTGQAEQGIALAKAQLSKPGDAPVLKSPNGDSTTDRDVHLALAQIDIRLKRWQDAASEIDKAEAMSLKADDKLSIYFLRGTLYDRQKMYDQADAEFRKVLAIDAQYAPALNYLGYMNADRGAKLKESFDMIQKAVELDPQNYAYLDSLGWAYFKLGQYQQAEDNLRKAVERSSSDPTVHDHLGEVYEKTGKLKLAVAQWERSMTEYAHSLPVDADPADVGKVQHKLEDARVKLAKVSSNAVNTAKP